MLNIKKLIGGIMSDDIDELKKEKAEQLQNPEQDDGKTVEVFTTPTCPYCVKLKNWLDSEGIEYTEHNVAQDKEKAMEMIRKTGQQGVPQTFVSDGEETQAIIGFQPDAVKQALSEA